MLDTNRLATPIHHDIASPCTASDPVREAAQMAGLSHVRWHHYEARARLLQSYPIDLAIGEGLVEEATFLANLARILGVAFSASPPAASVGTTGHEAFALGSYRTEGSDGIPVVAPRGAIAEILSQRGRDGRLPPILLTTRQALLERCLAVDAEGVSRRATRTLPPALSAQPDSDGGRPGRLVLCILAMLATGISIATILAPLTMFILLPLMLAPVFILAGLAILTATLESGGPIAVSPPLPTAELPFYSVLVPLYREAEIVPKLVERLSALIYPRDRIEAFLIVETDDRETAEALRTAELPPWCHLFIAPDGAPRTKPRALNAALPFIRGERIVVFDAEDEPEPDQLLRAAALFEAQEDSVACLQARLAITNVHDGFLTARFAIDYTALFDCVKAGMARAGWAVPLGGTSNHFRTDVLRQIGCWDAWNVTEDADLGIRLARFGWHVADLRSTTWEEAPNSIGAWMNQRSRWMKGWLQTLAVHLRKPGSLVGDLGGFRAVIILALAGSALLGAALYPALLLAIFFRLIDPVPLGGGSALLTLADSMLILSVTVAILAEAVPALVALRRRGSLYLAPLILLAPVTYLMVSVAMWRAMRDLLRRPYHWHKTRHGVARRRGGIGELVRPIRNKEPRPRSQAP